ncbi:MAG: Dabb family protein [bacterium]
MVKHIVMWTVKEGALGKSKEENALKLKEILEALKLKIPFIKKLEVGINYASDEAAYDVVLYSEFENREDLSKYVSHPDHQALKDFIINIRDKRCFVDYEC